MFTEAFSYDEIWNAIGVGDIFVQPRFQNVNHRSGIHQFHVVNRFLQCVCFDMNESSVSEINQALNRMRIDAGESDL